jgi:hypothetical protein
MPGHVRLAKNEASGLSDGLWSGGLCPDNMPRGGMRWPMTAVWVLGG